MTLAFETPKTPVSRKFALRLALCVALVVGTAGCVSTLGRGALVSQLEAVAGPKSHGVRIIPVHAESKMEAWARLSEARTEPDSSLSRSLAQQMKITRTRRVTFVVGGQYAELTDQILINALDLNTGVALPGLTLVVVSPAAPSPALTQLATRKRARLAHRMLTP